MLHRELSRHNSYYDDLTQTGAITYPELLPVPYDFFISLSTNNSNTIHAQQKIKHLINDKATITKLDSDTGDYQ
jgi:hypothetical protein